MKYLYLDNFRGFQNTSIPLADVNFLVGENSTGKTSLMTVLSELQAGRLIKGIAGWGDDPQLGHFSEMVSVHSKDQSYFRLGFAGDFTLDKKTVGHAMLLTYKKVDGVPQMSRITCNMVQGEVSVDFDDTQVFFKFVEGDYPQSPEEAQARLLDWARESPFTRGADWKEFGTEQIGSPANRMPLPVLLSFAASGPKKTFSFSMPPMAPNIVWVAPIRTRPRPTYDEAEPKFSSEGEHTPYVIKRILDSKSEAAKFKEFMRAVGEATGLFQTIKVKKWGKGETSPFEVDAYLDNKPLRLNSVGYGVSQSLPILVELFVKPKGSWFAIQQPEIHLHPRAQAALGDIFFEMATREHKRFFVETHSDFTIDRFRLNYRKKRSSGKAPQSQILFFERKNKCNVVTPIPIEADGELSASQPEGYRRFFIKEEMQMLGIR